MKFKRFNRSRLASVKRFIVGLTILPLISGGCVPSEPPLVDIRALQKSERESAREAQLPPKRALPTTLEAAYNTGTAPASPPTTGPALENDVQLRLSLQEIVHRAMLNNLDIKVEGYQPAIDETRVTAAEARFDPSFFQNLTFQRTDLESGFGFGSSNGRSVDSQTGIQQTLQSGGSVSFRYDANYTEPRTTFTRAPFWQNQLVLELTQPLLQNFGNEVNRANIVVSRNNQRISVLEFRKQVEQTTADIEKAYWSLYAAEKIVRYGEELLDRSVGYGDLLWKRRGQDVTRLDLAQANLAIQQRRTELIDDKRQVRDLSDQLKRLMNDPDLPVSSAVLILAADTSPPVMEQIIMDPKDQIDTAMDNRFELGEQQIRMDSAILAQRVFKNNLLPQLNAVGSVNFQGLDPNFDGAVDDQTHSRNLNYAVGLQFSIPLGNREARAGYARANFQRLQANINYQNLISQIALDVTQSLRAVDSSWQKMVASQGALFAAKDQLLAYEQREAGGEALTPEFVRNKLDAQRELALAQNQNIQSIADYNLSLSVLEQKKGTLLRYNNIVMEEDNVAVGNKPR